MYIIRQNGKYGKFTDNDISPYFRKPYAVLTYLLHETTRV